MATKRDRNAAEWSQQWSVGLEDCHNELSSILAGRQLDHSGCEFPIASSQANGSKSDGTLESLTRRLNVLQTMLSGKSVVTVTFPFGDLLNFSFCLCNPALLALLPKDPAGAKLLNGLLDVLIQLERQSGVVGNFRLSSKRIVERLISPLFELTDSTISASLGTVRSSLYSLTANLVLHGSLTFGNLNDLMVMLLPQILRDLGLTSSPVVWTEVERLPVSNSAKKNRKRRKLEEKLVDVTAVKRQPQEPWKIDQMISCSQLVINSIYTCGAFLKSELFRTLQSRIIRFCLQMQMAIPYEDDSSLFHHSQCRRNLYTILKALMVSPHPQVTPALHCAIRLFAAGRRDLSAEVVQTCVESSTICGAISRPRVRCWDNQAEPTQTAARSFLLADDEELLEDEDSGGAQSTVDPPTLDLPTIPDESSSSQPSCPVVPPVSEAERRAEPVIVVTQVIIGSDESSEDSESEIDVISTYDQNRLTQPHCDLPTLTSTKPNSITDADMEVTVEEMLSDFVDVK